MTDAEFEALARSLTCSGIDGKDTAASRFLAEARRARAAEQAAEAKVREIQDGVQAAVARDGLLILGFVRTQFPEHDGKDVCAILGRVRGELDALRQTYANADKDRTAAMKAASEQYKRADEAEARCKTLEKALRKARAGLEAGLDAMRDGHKSQSYGPVRDALDAVSKTLVATPNPERK